MEERKDNRRKGQGRRNSAVSCLQQSMAMITCIGVVITFTGYFLACRMLEMTVQDALRTAAKAASITVQGKGAAQSIPTFEEVSRAFRTGE